ncbi:MAG: hypothetical protein IIA41_10750 [SAR324 cluster bacterium]|nr:hypothetical protein [SAR324 cluster bacterium]
MNASTAVARTHPLVTMPVTMTAMALHRKATEPARKNTRRPAAVFRRLVVQNDDDLTLSVVAHGHVPSAGGDGDVHGPHRGGHRSIGTGRTTAGA